jgi:PKD repeat protein
MRLLTVMLVVALSVIGCGDGDSSSPTSPTPGPTPTPTPTPTPVPTTAALSGTVSSTTGQRIGGAQITVLDGPNMGQSVETNGNGEYRFESLTIAEVNFRANASGYLEDRRSTRVDGTNTLNFALTAAPPATITITSSFVSGGPGTPVQEWAFVATSTVPFSSYDWDFGDGMASENSGPQEQHVYRTKGRFTVKVTGNRSDGPPVVATLEIEVI